MVGVVVFTEVKDQQGLINSRLICKHLLKSFVLISLLEMCQE